MMVGAAILRADPFHCSHIMTGVRDLPLIKSGSRNPLLILTDAAQSILTLGCHLMPKHPTPDKRTQSERFIETARELGCDEDEAAFEEKLKRIASVKPKQIAKRKSSGRPRPSKLSVPKG
jgi:hypothetical protein